MMHILHGNSMPSLELIHSAALKPSSSAEKESSRNTWWCQNATRKNTPNKTRCKANMQVLLNCQILPFNQSGSFLTVCCNSFLVVTNSKRLWILLKHRTF